MTSVVLTYSTMSQSYSRLADRRPRSPHERDPKYLTVYRLAHLRVDQIGKYVQEGNYAYNPIDLRAFALRYRYSEGEIRGRSAHPY
jgi:hypothetical protein